MLKLDHASVVLALGLFGRGRIDHEPAFLEEALVLDGGVHGGLRLGLGGGDGFDLWW